MYRAIGRRAANACLQRRLLRLNVRGCAGLARGWGVRWNSGGGGGGDDFFAAVDQKTFTGFYSEQVRLEKEGKVVTLIPMQHVASAEFYDKVLEETRKDEHYIVLIEGLMDNDEMRQHEKNLCTKVAVDPGTRSKMQQTIADSSHYDENEERDLFEATFVPYEEGKELGLMHMELYWKPRLILETPLKVLNSDVNLDKVLAIEDPDERKFYVVHGRTDHCGKVLRELLTEDSSIYSSDAKSIAVCWGHIHCELLLDDLVSRGWTVTAKGPQRQYGWSEAFFNHVADAWKASDYSFDTILNQLRREEEKIPATPAASA